MKTGEIKITVTQTDKDGNDIEIAEFRNIANGFNKHFGDVLIYSNNTGYHDVMPNLTEAIINLIR